MYEHYSVCGCSQVKGPTLPYDLVNDKNINLEMKRSYILNVENVNTILSCGYSKSDLAFSVLPILFPGFPEDGHKEERGAAEASKREIRHQHRPSKVTLWKLSASPYFLPIFCSCTDFTYGLCYAGNNLLIQLLKIFFNGEKDILYHF